MTRKNELETKPNNWDLFVQLCEPIIDLEAVFKLTTVKIVNHSIYIEADSWFVYSMLTKNFDDIARFVKLFYSNEGYGLLIGYNLDHEKKTGTWQEMEYKEIPACNLLINVKRIF